MVVKAEGKKVFVTVGTTRFEDLIKILDTEECMHALERKGYREVLMQIGHGEHLPRKKWDSLPKMQIEYYRLNPHYKRDVAAADLVISHAGAGSIMDALSFKRKLLVVVNTLLMDNHQTELAEAMTEKNYCFQTTCKELVETIEKADFTKLKDYPEPDENAFPSVINGLMGVIT